MREHLVDASNLVVQDRESRKRARILRAHMASPSRGLRKRPPAKSRRARLAPSSTASNSPLNPTLSTRQPRFRGLVFCPYRLAGRKCCSTGPATQGSSTYWSPRTASSNRSPLHMSHVRAPQTCTKRLSACHPMGTPAPRAACVTRLENFASLSARHRHLHGNARTRQTHLADRPSVR